jgi:hypothetical protein
VELDFDAAVLVAVDFFAFGAGDHGGLAAEHARFRVFECRAVEHVPRGGEEGVAIALVEVVFVVGGVAGHAFFEDLRLLAFVEDFGEQPQVVPLAARVIGHFHEVAADQFGLVTTAFGLTVVGAMAFERALAEELAACAVDEAARVVVVFQIRFSVFAIESAIGFVRRFHLQARLFEVVVAARGAAGAGFQAQT